MGRYLAPNDTMAIVEVEGARTGSKRTLARQADGTIHVDHPHDVAALKAAGFTPAGIIPVTSTAGRGFQCECGRHNWFRKCGHCGRVAP